MRKRQGERYKQPAYYIENDTTTFFRCYTSESKTITNPMGVQMPLADGEIYVETDANIDFKHEHFIKINDVKLSINRVVSRDPKSSDLNARRGSPVYVTKMVIN